MENNELYHHGVKGMKWGQHIFSKVKTYKVAKHRKRNLEKARLTKAANKELADKKEQILRSGSARKVLKNRRLFTTDELQKAIDRIDKEQKLKEINNKHVSRGRKVVYDILEGSAKNVGQQTVTYIAGRGVNKVFAKIFDDPAIINPKKGQKDK